MKITYVCGRTPYAQNKLRGLECSHDINRLLVSCKPTYAKMIDTNNMEVSYCPAIGKYLCYDADCKTYLTIEEATAASKSMYNTLLDELKDPTTNSYFTRKRNSKR